jgi:hypothetical protein
MVNLTNVAITFNTHGDNKNTATIVFPLSVDMRAAREV